MAKILLLEKFDILPKTYYEYSFTSWLANMSSSSKIMFLSLAARSRSRTCKVFMYVHNIVKAVPTWQINYTISLTHTHTEREAYDGFNYYANTAGEVFTYHCAPTESKHNE